ncbi:FMN-binding split barrel-related protein [Penicillium alfredii]|uniref:FMN-binding split barrel-related protein n=1 Tax=Penicillium alfredii TaxID=1506179 RepID=A0A9W9EGV3_9EURO|nr:FMN-binding split barrel-related protein [Penicillium alfredii]KAJ5081485.1 FMN-binding split barrel-related protein [Penicillium alfredii]
MHLRPDHAVRDLPTLHAFIHAHPLGVLTTSIPSENHPTLQCSHIPWVLDSEDTETAHGTENRPALGVLRGHIARQNPQSQAIVEAVTTTTSSETPASATSNTIKEYTLPDDVLIVFTSPIDHYITPHFYTESKPATGKVAPTWNYAAVQVYGRATIYHDSKEEATAAFLRGQISDLARLGEVGVMGFDENTTEENQSKKKSQQQGQQQSGRSSESAPAPWKIADAPAGYIAVLLKNIVGMRIEIVRIEGRFKVSQERPVNDRGGVVEGLERMQTARAKEMADFVRRGRL